MSLDHPLSDIDSAMSTQNLMQRLRATDEALPETLQAQILAAGGAISTDLIAILEEALADDETDHGWAPAHAAKLLGRLGDGRAVPVLLRMLARYDALDAYYEDAAEALSALGDVAIEACLAAYPTADQDDLRAGIASVLHRAAGKDDRISHTLVDFLERSPELGAMYLAAYGDARAVPALSQMFDALPVDDQDGAMMANHVFVELRGAIEALGGQLTAAQTAKAERADASRRRFAAQMDEALNRLRTAAQPRRKAQGPSNPANREGAAAAARKSRKLGRNERCWCGSGKKYKKCHLDLDR